MTTRIDSHFHFWNPATRDYPWMPESLAVPYGPAELGPLLEANNFQASILVQTVSDVEETREFLATAAATPFVAGVVGWVDLTDPAMPQMVENLQAGETGRWLVGIRHQVHDEESSDWLLQETVQTNLNAIAEANLVYDLLVRSRELPAAISVARDFPHLRFVIDHIAKPPIASGELEPWASLMHEFAGLTNVACKFSGMVTEADVASWTKDDLLPYVATVADIFGPDRMMFGSDWPVCTLAATYQQVVETAVATLDQLGLLNPVSEAAIFGTTAAHWYGLPR